MPEICDNAIDDDMDGLIDLNDPDCVCKIIDPVSLIPNPSFEELDCCPQNRSQLDCANTWIQASEPTTDLIHMCGWMGWADFPPPTPFPDGEGIMGFRDGRIRSTSQPEMNWKEYAGSCLLSPMKAGTAYKFEYDVGFVSNAISPPINITFFGTTDCQYLPFGVGEDFFGCPTNGPNWVKLGAKRVTGSSSNQWVKSSIEITPNEDIYAIAIGPDCPGVVNAVSTYYFFDNLILADLRSFDFKIAEINHPCNSNFQLSVPEIGDFTYQWYLNGVALLGETDATLSKIYSEGEYKVRIIDDQSCKITKGYFFQKEVIRTQARVTICAETIFAFGDALLSETGTYVETFKSVNNCDSIVTLHLKELGELADTVQIKIFEGEKYKLGKQYLSEEGDHLVPLKSAIECDSLVLVQLAFYNVFLPNVFTPNNDGINDEFTVLGGDDLVEILSMKIYDRWGAFIFEGTNWNGLAKKEFAGNGVYTYVTSIRMDDNLVRQLKGSVTLLR